MALTSERRENPENALSTFYDKLAPDYDLMTGFEKRFVREKPFFRLLVDRYRIRTALDAGCGTGFHSLLLAQLGVEVTAIDVSERMLERLAVHANEMKLIMKLVRSSFQDLPAKVDEKFDAVFSLGNSLAHLLSNAELSRALSNFFLLLKPGGMLFIQNLNYDRILTGKERIQSVNEQDGVTFVRFYDYLDDRIIFNILKLQLTTEGMEHELNTVELRPLVKSELVQYLSQAGFREIQPYGEISMEEFDPQTSKDLVLLASKSQ